MELKPVISWCGSKRKLRKYILPEIPDFKGVYYEPFIGAGSIFLSLKPKNAVISDINPDIVNMWKQIKNNHKKLINQLQSYKVNKQTWTKMNNEFPKLRKNSTKKASYFMYLLSYTYMSFYIMNKNDMFYESSFSLIENRKKYKYNPKMIKNIENISDYLNSNNIKIKRCSYEEILHNIKKNDFVYLDPPYPSLAKSTKVDYKLKFDHEKFCDFYNKLKCKAVMSNLDCKLIRKCTNWYHIKNIKTDIPYGFNKITKKQIGIKKNIRKEILVKNF